jgi:hypothetical protein
MMWRGTEELQLLFMQLHWMLFSPVLQSSDHSHDSEIHLMKLLTELFLMERPMR